MTISPGAPVTIDLKHAEALAQSCKLGRVVFANDDTADALHALDRAIAQARRGCLTEEPDVPWDYRGWL